MKYALLIYGRDEQWAALGDDERKQMYAGHDQFGSEFGDKITGGAELQPVTSVTKLVQRGEETLVTDGPYAETAEQLGGFYLVEAADLDEATAMARKIPTLDGDVIEIRPLVQH